MEDYQIVKILTEPEGPNLEFKERVPKPKNIAQLISAFSNSDGGMILLGVGEKGAVFGVQNLDEAMNRISLALDLIKPRLDIKTSVETIDGKAVVVLSIHRSEKAPHSVNNLVFQRRGTALVPADSSSLYSAITKDSDSLDSVHTKITRLTQLIEEQNAQLIYAQSWRSKLPDMLIGGLIGAIISLLIQLFI